MFAKLSLYDYVLFLTFICLFIVMIKRTMKYMTRMGQNTGMLKNSKNVHVIAITTALVAPYLQGQRTENTVCKLYSIQLFYLKIQHVHNIYLVASILVVMQRFSY